jgi:hypothetical protein
MGLSFVNLFFILMSILVLVYLFYTYKSGKRINIWLEIFYILGYIFILLIFLFPSILNFLKYFFGIKSPVNFFLYLAIFVLFIITYNLYQKTEKQRIEITKLTREIAFLKNKK